jgi:hypothetical protein
MNILNISKEFFFHLFSLQKRSYNIIQAFFFSCHEEMMREKNDKMKTFKN